MKTGIGAIRERISRMSYQEILHQIDVEALLAHYGAENASEMPHKDGESTEILHSCLLDRVHRHHANGDAHPSASANIEMKTYVCWSFWGGDIIHFIMKMEGFDEVDQALLFAEGFLSGRRIEDTAFRDATIRLIKEMTGSSTHTYGLYTGGNRPSVYSDKVLRPWAFVHPYIVERGIDVETCRDWQIGWDEGENRITIPHFWNGDLVGWQKRVIPSRPGEWPGTKETYPKYRSSSGFPKSFTLYGYDRAKGADTVVVVESPMSVLKAASLGLQTPVVATFGAKIGAAQIDLLRSFDQVIIWMDGDDAGEVGERKLRRELTGRTLRVVDPEPGRDLGDYTDLAEVESALSGAVHTILIDSVRRQRRGHGAAR
ncbi:DNA primase [Gordonia phage Pupper]|uniref:DNA primase n=1 Tax=Gordonia phage Pupper TaxID=2571249 RepID=A0A4Y6ETJ5_9CAUD|nr:DNA primase [Gordonia phage Pupper]QDF18634.1 DNA primase [Gordonia phage Pupper]